MHYGLIRSSDVANGPGVRISLFVSGCTNQCKGCFQPETWDFHYGKEYTSTTENSIIEALRPIYIQGLTLLGGEPMEPENQAVLVHLVKRVRKELPQKNIWCYTGFTLEKDLAPGCRKYCESTEEFLRNIDVLVDGQFKIEKKNISLKFRGSDNQRLIDMKRTVQESRIVLLEQ